MGWRWRPASAEISSPTRQPARQGSSSACATNGAIWVSNSAMKRIAVGLAALLLLPATAHAGTYHVYACGAYPNNSWTADAAGGLSVDTSCTGGTIGVSV